MPVDTGGARGAYARFAIRPSESVLNELVSGTVKGGAAGSTTSTSYGLAFLPASTNTTWAITDPLIDPYVSGDFSLFWYGILPGDKAQRLIECTNVSWGWNITTTVYAPGAVVLGVGSKWRGDLQISTVQLTDGATPLNIIFVYTHATTNGKLYVNGTKVLDTTFLIDPGAMTAPQTYSMQGDATSPQKVITCQAFNKALSTGDVATLNSTPMDIFAAGGITLTGANSTQANACSVGAIGVNGGLVGANCAQTNSCSTGAITKLQTLTGANCTQTNTCSTGSIDPYGRLRALLNAAEPNTWVQANVNSFLDTVVSPSDLPVGGLGNSAAVVYAWSSFAWDDENGNLLLWGGGHANYEGNELYIWNGSSGNWGLGSLPSYVLQSDSSLVIPSKDGPQSAHTYQNNCYLPNNKAFHTFQGAAAPSGGPMEEIVTYSPHVTRRVGSWSFDLSKADPNKVGGADGTGFDTSRLGSNAWNLHYDRIDSVGPLVYDLTAFSHVGSAAAICDEDGVDVAYFTLDAGGSGFPYWCRYEFGDIRSGGRDTFSKIGNTSDGVIFDGFGVYDSTRGMFYRNSVPYASYGSHDILALDVLGRTTVGATTGITVIDEDSNPFHFNDWTGSDWVRECHYGCVYDPENDRLWFWRGDIGNPGKVYYIQLPAWSSGSGWATTTWTIVAVDPAGSTPRGNHIQGVLGKMKYVKALGAFVVMDSTTIDRLDDPGVWFFKTTNSNILSGAGCTQLNTCSADAVVIDPKNLAGAPCIQFNICITGSIDVVNNTSWIQDAKITSTWKTS